MGSLDAYSLEDLEEILASVIRDTVAVRAFLTAHLLPILA